MAITYNKTTWSGDTKITPSNFNNIENGISSVTSQSNSNETKIGQLTSDLSGANGKLANAESNITTLDQRADELQQKKQGTNIVFDNLADEMRINKLVMYGKSTQEGVPTPSAPKDIVSVVNPVLNMTSRDSVQHATIPYALRSIGDVKDELIINADGTGQLVQRIYRYQVTSSSNIATVSSGGLNTFVIHTYFNSIFDRNKPLSTISNIYTSQLSGLVGSPNDYVVGGYASNNVIDIFINHRYYTSVDEFKNYLISQKAVFDILLDTPIIHNLSIQQVASLKAYAPTTTISNNQNAEMDIELRHTHNNMATYGIGRGNFVTANTVKGKAQVRGRVNYLQPALQSTTKNGVTITRNNNGTFTLNGTATAWTEFLFANITPSTVAKYDGFKLLGANGLVDMRFGIYDANYLIAYDKSARNSEGVVLDNLIAQTYPKSVVNVSVVINPNVVCNNVVLKPMITDDLSATYDDFVPYEYEVRSDNGDNLTDVAIISPICKSTFLDTFDGQTNITSDYNADLSVTVATNEVANELLTNMGNTFDYFNTALASATALVLENGGI